MTLNSLSPDFGDSPGSRIYPRNYTPGTATSEHTDVSIITPYYNTEAFFIETFLSLQAQTLQNWEWVIVDDGSSDQKSVERLVDVGLADQRIVVVHIENVGPAAARNASFQRTAGRYVCLLDSDDLLEPTYLEKCVWFLDSNPEFAFCNSFTVAFGEQEFLWTAGFERGKAHLQANIGPIFSVIRRAAYVDCGGFDKSIRFGHEDWDFWLAMANAGHWGYTIPEFMQWYRKRSGGRFEQILSMTDVNDDFGKFIRQKYRGLEKTFPEPFRCQPMPYAAIDTQPLVCNSIAENSLGRRVMFIVPWMVVGGADRVNLDLIEGLTSRGHDVTVVATLTSKHLWEHEFSRFTSDIFILPNFLQISDYPRFLLYLIQSRKIDTVVITGSTLGYQLLPYLRAFSPSVAYVDICHVEEPHWLNGGHPRFGVGYQDMLDLNIATTKSLVEWMCRRGAEPSRVEVMYTGVRSVTSPRQEKLHVRAELGIGEDVPIIVFAGRLCEQKRPMMLAQILRGIHEKGLIFRALIIGEGVLKQELEALIVAYQLDEMVQMLGTVPHARWLNILSTSDILLMPSQYEGISVALLEAIAAGVVPVVADVGGQREIVSPDSGVLVPLGDNEVQEYVESLDRLLSDSVVLEEMSNQCRANAESKLSWDGMIDRFLAVIDRAHSLRLATPRNPISRSMGRELAIQTLEYRRLSDAADWLSNARLNSKTLDSEWITTPLEMQAAARFAIALSQTWLGRKVIRNQFLQSVGKYLFNRIGKKAFP